MSKLLEIFGRAITVDGADLIWHWFHALKTHTQDGCVRNFGELDEILDHLGERQLEKAQEKLNFYLFENPDCCMGRMAAAALCLHNNDLDDTLEQLQSVYLRQPSNTMALYMLGHCYERQHKEAQAIEFYQDCIKFKSHLQLPRQRMAAIYYKNGKLDKTIEQYEALTAEHPEDIASMVLLGYLYIANRQFENATTTFNMSILSHPDNFHDDTQNEEIDELIESEQFDKAIENVQWLVDKVGEMPDLYVRMGDIYSKAGHVADAIVNYENAIRMQPNYLEATIKLGTHYLRCQRPTLAAEQFNRAVEINDDIVDAYMGLAEAQHLDDEIEQAHSTMSLAAAIQQNSTLLFSETATLHLQTTLQDGSDINSDTPPEIVEIEDVIKAHQKQLAFTPRNADIHYKFGILMMVVKDLKRAAQSLENALEINPTHHRARVKLTLCQHETAQEGLAIETLVKPEPITLDTLRLHYETAILYCDKAKFAKAVLNLESTMKNNFTQPDATLNVEVVLENLGLIDRAVATWDRLTETAHNAIGARYR